MAVGARAVKSQPGSPGQRDCAVSSGTGGLLRGRMLPPSSNATWFSISLTKFREHWTSPWPGKKLRIVDKGSPAPPKSSEGSQSSVLTQEQAGH